MPKLILVNGPCAVGKTTYAKQLAKQIPNSMLIEGDVLRRWFTVHESDRQKSHQQLVGLLCAIANYEIPQGVTVVVDKAFPDSETVGSLQETVGGNNFVEVLLSAGPQEIMRRAEARGYSDSFSAEDVQRFIDLFQGYNPVADNCFKVDATHDFEIDISQFDL